MTHSNAHANETMDEVSIFEPEIGYLVAPPLKVNVAEARIWLDDEAIHVGQKAFRLLCALMQRPEKLWTKDELIDIVWDGRSVTDAVLTTAMKELRKALAEPARNPRFIETVHGRGYRFLLPVKAIPAQGAEPDGQQSSQIDVNPAIAPNPERTGDQTQSRSIQNWQIAAGIAFVVVLATVWFFNKGSAPDPGAGNIAAAQIDSKSIAVLPFEDFSPDGDQAYFAAGVAEEILNALVRMPQMQVAGRTSSFSYKGRNVDLRDIGTALNVAHIIEGSVRKQGDKVRITAQLVRVDDGFHLWSETYDGTLDNIFDLQEEISRAIATELDVILNDDGTARFASALTDNQEAYDLFLQARTQLRTSTNDDVLFSARSLLERAVDLDPNFADAWAMLSYANTILAGLTNTASGAQSMQAALDAANRAIELDPDSVSALTAFSIINTAVGNIKAGVTAAEKAARLEPDNATALGQIGARYLFIGRAEAAIPYLERATALDPNFAVIWTMLGNAYLATGDYERADDASARGFERGHYPAGQTRAWVSYTRNDKQSAFNHIMTIYTFAGAQLSNEIFTREVWELGARAVYLDSETDKIEARRFLEQTLKASPEALGVLMISSLAHLGYIEEFFSYWNAAGASKMAITEHLWSDLPWAKAIRQHPEFQQFAADNGFVDAWNQAGWPDKCRPLPGDDNSGKTFECS